MLRNYSRKTLAAYRLWVGKFQAFVRSRPTSQLGSDEVRGFLSELAVRHGVAASTQNQAFNALRFFYRHILRREFGQLDGAVRAKRHRYVPVVLSRPETGAVLDHLQPPYRHHRRVVRYLHPRGQSTNPTSASLLRVEISVTQACNRERIFR